MTIKNLNINKDDVFGRLTVIKEQEERGKKGSRIYLCKCECGNEVNLKGYTLKNGHTKSCGCLVRELSATKGKNRVKHGKCRTPEYYVWNGTIYELVNSYTETDPLALKIASNLSDLNSVSTARTNLGLGTLATQSGTFTDKLDANVSITGATKTKITYDSKGLVTAGADATTADIADSTNKRYVTDANLTTIGNQLGTNTGDNATNTQYSGLASSKEDTSNKQTNLTASATKFPTVNAVNAALALKANITNTLQSEDASITRTLALTDAGTTIPFTYTNPITVTVPTNATVAFPIGSTIGIYPAGTGSQSITISGAGVTFINNDSVLYPKDFITLLKTNTDTWIIQNTPKNNPVFARTVYSPKFNSTGNGGFVFGDAATGMSALGNEVRFVSYLGTTGNAWNFNPIYLNTSVGNLNILNFSNTINPTSGTATFNGFNLSPIINQTGGASGITRGLYINPTLTSAADFRALDIVSGKVMLPATMPTGSGTEKMLVKDSTTGQIKQLDIPSVSGSTDLSYTASPTGGTVVSSSGTDATLPLADGTNAGLLAPADFTKLGNQSGTNTGDNATNTTSDSYADGKVTQTITNGVTTTAPSEDVVFDALALKANDASVVHLTGNETIAGDKNFTGTVDINLSANAFKATSVQGMALEAVGGNNGTPIGKFTRQSDLVEIARFDNSGLKLQLETASTIASFDANKNIKSLPTATYPDLTELSYVKGVTSGIQNQFSGKQPLATNLTSLAGLTYSAPAFVKMTSAGTFTLDTSGGGGVTTFSGGITGLTPNTATSGAVTLAGTLNILNGGTGATTAPQARINLGGSTLGINIFTAASPSAITFLRINADNTPSYLDAPSFRTAIGIGTVVTSLSTIGTAATANTNGATITGSVLNLEPASASFGGVVTTGVQTIAGVKTFNSSPLAPTPAIGVSNTTVATTQFVSDSINAATPGTGYGVFNILITSTSPITTITSGTSNSVSYSQNGRNVMIQNSSTNITITVDPTTPTDFIASYTKLSVSGVTITFQTTNITTWEAPNGYVLNGRAGSTALLTRNGTSAFLLINNIL